MLVYLLMMGMLWSWLVWFYEEDGLGVEVNVVWWVWVFSGRSSVVREQTIDWLNDNTVMSRELLMATPELLTMRDEGDYTEDHLLKASWVDRLLKDDFDRLICVFDDRSRVVDMWRSKGVTCLQVAPGDF
jgi:hypothetical protein